MRLPCIEIESGAILGEVLQFQQVRQGQRVFSNNRWPGLLRRSP
jgi:hypothetical protein